MSKQPRPGIFVIHSLFILGLSLLNGLRLIQALRYGSILESYQASPGPVYIALSGGFWAGAGLITLLGIWRRRIWGWFLGWILLFLYLGWYWFDRLALQQPHDNWPFMLVLSGMAVLLACSFFLPIVRRYFFSSSDPPSVKSDPTRKDRFNKNG
jgi:hypothetical protein